MDKIQKIIPKGAKRVLMIATLALFSACALFAIILVIDGGTNSKVISKLLGTSAVLGLLTLLSLHNIIRMESDNKTIRTLSTVSLISNIFWSIPWLILIWDILTAIMCSETMRTYGSGFYSYSYPMVTCSDGYKGLVTFFMQVAFTAGIISAIATAIANFLNIKNYSPMVKNFKLASIGCGGFLGVYILPGIWINNGQYIADTYKFVLIVFILFIYASVVTAVLVKIERSKTNQPIAPTLPTDGGQSWQEVVQQQSTFDAPTMTTPNQVAAPDMPAPNQFSTPDMPAPTAPGFDQSFTDMPTDMPPVVKQTPWQPSFGNAPVAPAPTPEQTPPAAPIDTQPIQTFTNTPNDQGL
ncbi:hypothetical protein FWF74_03090 [Candidatus Saccharibacteria bacterium]|nr:hypothetical protein [Candidatus Saccharibacteria bacterium]MCL1962921.1 hypothetical protein [Candidatus Saccharibacteria bacterium]